MSLSTCSMQPAWKEALSCTGRLTGTRMGKKCERICARTSQQRGYRDSREMALPEVLPKNGNEVGTLEGWALQSQTSGRQDLAWRIHGTPGHTPPLGCHHCQPHFGTFLWSCIPQSNHASHSQLFCLCASSLHSLGFYSTHHALLSSLKFILVHLTGKGHVDPAQPLNDRSCPHTTNTPKSKTFPWLQCIHRPKITLCPQHTKHPVCCGHDYFGHFAFPICLNH